MMRLTFSSRGTMKTEMVKSVSESSQRPSNLMTLTMPVCSTADPQITDMQPTEGTTASMQTLRLSSETCGEFTLSVKMELSKSASVLRDNPTSTFMRHSTA